MKTKSIILTGLLAIGIILIIGCLEEEQKPTPQTHLPLKNSITSSVKVMDGIPRLFVGDETIPLSGFFIYKGLYAEPEETIKHINYAAEHGFSFVIVSMWWSTMDSEKKLDSFPVDAAERIDWTKLDNALEYAAGKGVYVIPAFRYYCSPPEWWYTTEGAKNKYYTQTNEKGETTWMPSFNAKPHEKYAEQVIAYMVDRYKDHPALLGWELGFGWTVENNYPSGYESEGWYDYSPFSKEQFRDWLKKTYNGDVSSLRESWEDDTVTFENAEMPEPLPPQNDLDNLGVNAAGDTRRQFYDWQLFKLQEKKMSREHFARFFKELDTDHVLFASPSGGPLASRVPAGTAYALNLDYYDYALSPYIDGIFVCPGFTDNQKINEIYTPVYYDLVNYFHKMGKATFIDWENWGVNELETLQYIINISDETGTGIVLATGGIETPDGSGQTYPYSEEQIREIARNLYLLENPIEVKKRRFAFVDTPFLSAIDYQEMGYYEGAYHLSQYKGKDAYFTAKLFRDAGLEYDVLSEGEIIKNPDILNDYAAVGIVDLFRMTEESKDILIDYRDNGGGLFIVGRSAVFDEYGNYDLIHLQQLLGISSPLSEHKLKPSVFEADSSWGFVEGDKSGLIGGIEGNQGDAKSYFNLFNIPTFYYTREGYNVIGRLNSNPEIATVGYKGKIVFWFPRLGMQIYDRNDTELKTTLRFLENLYMFYGIK